MRPGLRQSVPVVAASLVLVTVAALPAQAASAPPEAALTGVRHVEVGTFHSCAVLANRQARCWGHGSDGELGTGSFDPQFNTAQVVRNPGDTGPLQGVVQVALGDHHTCARLANGQVRCWGDNADGQLGNGDAPNDQSLPVAVRNADDTANLADVRRISAYSFGMCALLANREVRCWGADNAGQLGNDVPVSSTELPVAVLNVAGSGNLRNVAALSSGTDSNCAVLTNGQARCWGANGEGGLGNYSSQEFAFRPVVVKNELGTGPLTGVTQISTGAFHTCARLASGQARCWGGGGQGELGDGGGIDNPRPSIVRTAGGGPLTGIRRVFAASQHSC